MSNLVLKEQVDELTKGLLTLPQLPCPVIHRFGPGTYIREVSLPAGAIVVGHWQRFEHTNVFLKGRVTMLNDDGTSTELKAPMIFVGKPGRKVGYIHEEVTWLNIYPTEEQDVSKLEEHFLDKGKIWDEDQERRKLRRLQTGVDQKDFAEACSELGVTQDEVRTMSEYEGDQATLPHGAYKIKVSPSAIEGKGLFATADIAPGEFIAPARINDRRTIAGRYTNHSANPNAEFQSGWLGDLNLVALKSIKGCEGGQDGEEITINYRQAVLMNGQLKEKLCQQP